MERAFGLEYCNFVSPLFEAQLDYGMKKETLQNIMTTCIIIHNMIVEDEGTVNPDEHFDQGGDNVAPSHKQSKYFDEFIENHINIRSDETHINFEMT